MDITRPKTLNRTILELKWLIVNPFADPGAS